MSAPPDLDVLKILVAECDAHGFELDVITNSNSAEFEDARFARDLLYLVSSLLGGGWCDFGFHPNDQMHSLCACTRAALNKLRCRPLLEPWLRGDVDWTAEDVAELKTKHAVASELTNHN